MNGFEQIKSFYSWVFNNPDKVKQSHISLYLFLINQNNRSMWVEWFKCPYDLAMQGSCIGSKSTYYKTLNELDSFGLLEYKKGENNYKAPLIKLICLYKNEPQSEQVTVPLSKQVTAPQTEQLSVPLTGNIYKLITNNIELLTDNESDFIFFIDSLKINDSKFSFLKSLISLGAKKELAEDWLKVRKTKKLTNTKTAFESFKTELEKSGKEINEVLTKCCAESWGGFKSFWEWNRQNNIPALSNQQNDNYFAKRKRLD